MIGGDRMTADERQRLSGTALITDQPAIMIASPRRPVSPETQRLYKADWASFEGWCGARALTTLPADPATVAAFLTEAATSVGAGALGRRAAAITSVHRQFGLASPAADPAVTDILRRTRRSATPRRPPPAKPAALVRMATRCPRDLAGLRDRALLLLAAGGLGRAALVGLDVEHILFVAGGAELSARPAGVDRTTEHARNGAKPDRKNTTIVVPRGTRLAVCPVQALRDWLDGSSTRFGPVFRKIDRWGTIEHDRLGTDAIRRILARRAPRRSRRAGKATVA
jgi:integrase